MNTTLSSAWATLVRSGPTDRLVSDGRTWCPRRGDLDYEVCLDCHAFRGITQDADGTWVRCGV